MNNDNETRAYPCDEPAVKNNYPCDTDGEAFSYAAEDTSAEKEVRKGKGRRGGNAAASVVVHSGKFKTRPNTDRRQGRDGDDRDRSFGRRERFGRDDRRSDRDGNRFDRDDRRTDRDGNRFDRDDRRSDRESNRFDRDDRRFDRDKRSFSDRDGRRFDRAGRSDDRREGRERFGRDERRFDKGGRDSYRGGRERFGRDDRRDDSQRRGRDDRRRSREQAPESVFSKAYTVRVVKTSEVGAFVEAPRDLIEGAFGRRIAESGTILLPFAEQLGRPKSGDEVTVYFYDDKGGRMTATMRTPILRDGEVGLLTVAAVTSIGAFLDNGVPKQVLLPFKEQIVTPNVGDEVLVWLYTDKSGRQAATMRVYGHLDRQSPYKEDDRVTGFVYEINPKLGIFIAVDNKYYGLVPIRETFKEYEYGDEVEARVVKVRDDGKLDLLIRDKLYKTVNEDADVILYELRRNDGFLPYGDRADAEFIEETYAMSKNQFKRALGHLYKNRIVELDREKDTVKLIKK